MIPGTSTYIADEAGKTIALRVEASSFPNQGGIAQKRTITSLTPTELKLTNPTAANGGQINYEMKRSLAVVLN